MVATVIIIFPAQQNASSLPGLGSEWRALFVVSKQSPEGRRREQRGKQGREEGVLPSHSTHSDNSREEQGQADTDNSGDNLGM
jgi:hypothetical protein